MQCPIFAGLYYTYPADRDKACVKASISGEDVALHGGDRNGLQGQAEGESESLLADSRHSAVELAPLYHESFRTG